MSEGRPAPEGLQQLGLRVLEQVKEAVAIIDRQFRVAWVNPEFCRITGYSADEIVGQPLTVLRSGVHEESDYQSMKNAVISDGHWHGEVWRKRRDGSSFPAWLTISTIYDEHGQPEWYVDLFVDIEGIRQQREELEFLVNHDQLTGLPNRRLFWDRLENTVRRCRRSKRKFGLLFIDLNHFKDVNDHHGHSTGDEVLVRMANTLKKGLRECDTIARVGGDEFAVILEDLEDHERGDALLERVRDKLASFRFKLPDGRQVSASLGLAVYPHDGHDAASLYDSADLNMYSDKRRARQ